MNYSRSSLHDQSYQVSAQAVSIPATSLGCTCNLEASFSLVVVLVVQNAENEHEQVQHIQIQRDRSSNLFLDVVVTHDHLGIKNDIATEQQCTDNTVGCVNSAVEGEKRGNEAKHY